MTSEELLELIKKVVVKDNILSDVVQIKVGGKSNIADYLLIGTAYNPQEAEGIAELIIDTIEENGFSPRHVDGMDEARWIVIDYGTILVHIMVAASREYYKLEKLWADEDNSNLLKIN